MLDDLRKQVDPSAFEAESPEPAKKTPQAERRILGMTAFQRFIVALLLLSIVCLLGITFLLVTQKVVLPFF